MSVERVRTEEGAAVGAVVEVEHERPAVRTHWLCEKWSEEAVDFARAKLERRGVEMIQDGSALIPITHGVTSEMLRRFVGPPEETQEIAGNLLLNEGIQRLLDLLIGAGGTTYANASAYIGVGTSTTGEVATQTELQGAADSSNRFYKAMVATWPQRTNQTVDWRSDFTSTEANFVWAEWTVSSGATTASGSGFLVGTTNLNRKVQPLGTKTTGTWTMTGSITIS